MYAKFKSYYIRKYRFFQVVMFYDNLQKKAHIKMEVLDKEN